MSDNSNWHGTTIVLIRKDKDETTEGLSSFSSKESLAGNDVIFVFCFIYLNFFYGYVFICEYTYFRRNLN